MGAAKHDWRAVTAIGEKAPLHLLASVRECRNCGKRQERQTLYDFDTYSMRGGPRVRGYRWSPRAGRCKVPAAASHPRCSPRHPVGDRRQSQPRSRAQTMIWVVRCKIGVFWDGPTYLVGSYRWRWLADWAVWWQLGLYPYRQCHVTPRRVDDWHPWKRRGRWIERRVLASWFSDHVYFRDPDRAALSEKP